METQLKALPYFIAQGTTIVREFKTIEEMFDYHKKMIPIDRHFCKLYDYNTHRLIEGCYLQWDYSDRNPNWRKWQ